MTDATTFSHVEKKMPVGNSRCGNVLVRQKAAVESLSYRKTRRVICGFFL
jgi:hypothetical protein